jgi:hypothetical protein
MGPRSGRGRQEASTLQDEAVGLQYRTRADGELHSPAIGHYTPSKDFYLFTISLIFFYCTYCIYTVYIFLL